MSVNITYYYLSGRRTYALLIIINVSINELSGAWFTYVLVLKINDKYL